MAAGKNVHLEHLEDEIINNGVKGGEQVVKILKEMGNLLAGTEGAKPLVTTKWDGAPAIVCGTDPIDGQFFVGTKSVFAKTAPKICKSINDVQSMYDGTLAGKLTDAYRYLKDSKIKGVLQGDLMFTNDKETKVIDKKKYITFRPNTITYAADPYSKLGQEIKSAKLGIVFHTKYTGPSLPEMKSSFDIKDTDFKASGQVWIQKAEFKNVSGAATFSKNDLRKYNEKISKAEQSTRKAGRLLNDIQSGKKTLQIDTELKKFFNAYVKKGSSIPPVHKTYVDFMYHLGREYDKVLSKNKTLKAQADKAGKFMEAVDFIEKNQRQFKDMLQAYKDIQEAKLMLVDKMKKISSLKLFVDMGNGNYKATTPEGFVAISGDQAVKLIDRMEFARLNFIVPKQW